MYRKYKKRSGLSADDVLAAKVKYSQEDFTFDGIKYIWIPADTNYKVSKNFHINEFLSKCSDLRYNGHYLDERLLVAAQFIRDNYGAIRITSSHRHHECNRIAGGFVKSFHLQERALDLVFMRPGAYEQFISDFQNKDCTYLALLHMGIGGIGIYDVHLHIDTGRERSWDYRGNLMSSCCE